LTTKPCHQKIITLKRIKGEQEELATAAQIRSQIEAVLAHRIPSALTPKFTEEQESISCGFEAIDQLQAFPRGSLIEIYGPASSGRTTLLHGLLANCTAKGEAVAMLDAADTFDPVTAKQNGVVLKNLLWARPGPTRMHKGAQLGPLDQMLMAAEIILQSGGFGLVILDLANTPAQDSMKIPATSWFTMLRSVENTRTAFVSVVPHAIAGSSASVTLRLEQADVKPLRAKHPGPFDPYVEGGCLIDSIGFRFEIMRSRQRKSSLSTHQFTGFATTVQRYG
jgi:hypothetical protein